MSDGDNARLFLRDDGDVTEDNAAERFEVTDWESDLWEVLDGIVLRFEFGMGADVYMLTVP